MTFHGDFNGATAIAITPNGRKVISGHVDGSEPF